MKALVVTTRRFKEGLTRIKFLEGQKPKTPEKVAIKEATIDWALWDNKTEALPEGSWTTFLTKKEIQMNRINLMAVAPESENETELAARIVRAETPKSWSTEEWNELTEEEKYIEMCEEYNLKPKNAMRKGGPMETWLIETEQLVKLTDTIKERGVMKTAIWV